MSYSVKPQTTHPYPRLALPYTQDKVRILLARFLSSSAQWILNLNALGKVCQPVTVDLWGHGKSPAPEDRHLYTAHYGEQFEYIRTTLGSISGSFVAIPLAPA